MQNVTDALKASIGAGPAFRTACTVTVPGGSPTTLEVKTPGSLTVDRSNRVRRQIQSFSLVGGSTDFDLVDTPGALFKLSYGVALHGTDPEMLPIFAGEAQKPKQRFGDGTIAMTLVDLAGSWLSRCTYSSPYLVGAGTSRTAAIAAAVLAARPGTVIVDTSTATGTLSAQQMWTTGPLDVIADLARDAGVDAFFGPEGSFYIRDLPTITSPAVWSIRAGAGGTLKNVDRERPIELPYNRVNVVAKSRDASQTWAMVYAEVTDPGHPRHKSKIGEVPLELESPTANQVEAQAIANRELERALAATETLSLEAIAFAALEPPDVVRVVTGQINSEPAKAFQHYLDAYTVDLAAGSMTASTRSQVVSDG